MIINNQIIQEMRNIDALKTDEKKRVVILDRTLTNVNKLRYMHT